jgi:hypothetical protein
MPKSKVERIDNKPKKITAQPGEKASKRIQNEVSRRTDQLVGNVRAKRNERRRDEGDVTGAMVRAPLFGEYSARGAASRKKTNSERDMKQDEAVAEKAFKMSDGRRMQTEAAQHSERYPYANSPDHIKFGFDKKKNKDGTLNLKKNK